MEPDLGRGSSTILAHRMDRGWVELVAASAQVYTPKPSTTPGLEGIRRSDDGVPVMRGVAVRRDWAPLVCAAPFTWSCEWALAVIDCESSGNPGAVGHEVIDDVDYYFYGLFQVWNGPLDPYANALDAHVQYVEWQRGKRGRPWPNCP